MASLAWPAGGAGRAPGDGPAGVHGAVAGRRVAMAKGVPPADVAVAVGAEEAPRVAGGCARDLPLLPPVEVGSGAAPPAGREGPVPTTAEGAPHAVGRRHPPTPRQASQLPPTGGAPRSKEPRPPPRLVRLTLLRVVRQQTNTVGPPPPPRRTPVPALVPPTQQPRRTIAPTRRQLPPHKPRQLRKANGGPMGPAGRAEAAAPSC